MSWASAGLWLLPLQLLKAATGVGNATLLAYLLLVAGGAVGSNRICGHAHFLTDLNQQRTHVGAVGVGQQVVSKEDLASFPQLGKGGTRDAQGLGVGFLAVHDRQDRRQHLT